MTMNITKLRFCVDDLTEHPLVFIVVTLDDCVCTYKRDWFDLPFEEFQMWQRALWDRSRDAYGIFGDWYWDFKDLSTLTEMDDYFQRFRHLEVKIK